MWTRRGSRSRNALARLFVETRAYVYGVALHATGNPAAAGDATQEVYLKLMAHLGQYAGRAGFRTWLFRVTVNAARDQHRRGRRLASADPVTVDIPDPAPSAREELIAAERAALVRRQLARLPDSLRLPLVLRYVAGLSYDEIGQVLSLRAGTVASRLSRGLSRLGRSLTPTGEEE
jgi:RNA polymerase sigma-70 factor, ECF subfamily